MWTSLQIRQAEIFLLMMIRVSLMASYYYSWRVENLTKTHQTSDYPPKSWYSGCLGMLIKDIIFPPSQKILRITLCLKTWYSGLLKYAPNLKNKILWFALSLNTWYLGLPGLLGIEISCECVPSKQSMHQRVLVIQVYVPT